MFKKIFLITSAILALVIVGLVVAINTVDLNKYKPQLVQIVQEQSGYELKIGGDIGLSLAPVGLHVADISIAKPSEKPFAKLKDFSVAIEILPFLFQEIKVDYLLLSDLDVTVIKGAKGKFNFEVAQKSAQAKPATTQEEKSPLPLVSVNKIKIKNVNLSYTDVGAKTKATVNNLGLQVENIGYDASKDPLKALFFDAKMDIQKLSYQKYNITDLKANLKFKDAIASLNSLVYTIFGSNASANALVDLNFAAPHVAFVQNIPQLGLENFSKEIIEKDLLSGTINLKSDIKTVLGDAKEIKKTLQGKLTIEGKGVGIKGYDIDKVLSNYGKSQSIDPVDIGSFLVAGPLGFVLSKSSDGAGAYSGLQGGSTLLQHLNAQIDFAKGSAKLSDVAMATGQNRIALRGDLDLVGERFVGLQLGILDAGGCAKYAQSIEGTFSNPKVKVDEGMVNTVVNMASSFFGKVANIAKPKSTEPCKVFYSGIVKHP